MKITVKQLVRGALIAALYAALTIFLAPISFGSIQFRLSEVLTVLPFIMPEAVPGLTIGCLLANWLGGSTIFDIIFGTIATFLAAFITSKTKNMWLAPLPAVVSNGVIVGFVVTLMTVDFTLSAYALIALSISISEFIICYVGGIPFLVFMNGVASKYSFFK